MDQEFSTRQTTESKSGRSSFRMEESDISIPQGPVLGPTLFVLFITRLPQVVESPVALFAEDTKVFREIQSARTGRSCSKTMMNCKYGQQSGNLHSMRVNAMLCTMGRQT